MKGRFNVLRISTAFPTLKEIPKNEEDEASLVDVKTATKVEWPDNWHTMPSRWKAVLLKEITLKVVRSFLTGLREEGTHQEVVDHYRDLMGIAKPPADKKTKKKTKKRSAADGLDPARK